MIKKESKKIKKLKKSIKKSKKRKEKYCKLIKSRKMYIQYLESDGKVDFKWHVKLRFKIKWTLQLMRYFINGVEDETK